MRYRIAYKIAFLIAWMAALLAAFYRSADAGVALIVGAVLGVIGLWIDDETRTITGGKVLPPEPWPDPPAEGFIANPAAKGFPQRPRPIPLPLPKSPQGSGFEKDEERTFDITCRRCGNEARLSAGETGQGNTCIPCQALVIEELEREHGAQAEPIRDVTGDRRAGQK